MSIKIAVAFSGGIDSAIAAWILKESGYNITAICLKILDQDNTTQLAKFVADILNIPLKILDVRNIFKQKILTSFISEYSKGRTPNPCIDCNAKVKFGFLLDWVLENNFQFLATGHYAKIEYNPQKGSYFLLRGLDEFKDQSYFLYRLSQNQLSHILFPLGDLTKSIIRDVAESLNLSKFKQKESQEICFLEGGDYRNFFIKKSKYGISSGPVFDKNGEKLGIHKGLAFYTIGQRKGLNLSKRGPFYVLEIDKDENKIVVGSENDLMQHTVIADQIHYINKQYNILRNNKSGVLSDKVAIQAKIRYNQEIQNAYLEVIDEFKVKLTFDKSVRAVAPGQSVVFYKNDRVIGGGIICRGSFA